MLYRRSGSTKERQLSCLTPFSCLFTYNYRLYDKYRRPIASLALLADERENWKPTRYGYELFGCRMGIDFPRRQTARLPRPGSAARRSQPLRPGHCRPHRLTRQTKGDNAQRYAAKWRLAKLLYQRDWDKQRIIDLFSVLDWMLQVPPELQRQLWHEIDQLERNRQMPYITSVERMGIEKGLQQGLQQGKLEGKLEGEVALLERQLSKRFGPLTEDTRARLRNATTEQIEIWAERVLDAKTLEDVFGEH